MKKIDLINEKRDIVLKVIARDFESIKNLVNDEEYRFILDNDELSLHIGYNDTTIIAFDLILAKNFPIPNRISSYTNLDEKLLQIETYFDVENPYVQMEILHILMWIEDIIEWGDMPS